MSLSEPELRARYRNLLIVLATEIVLGKARSASLKLAAEKEKRPRNKAGLRTLLRCNNGRVHMLQRTLARNRAALRHFFGSTKPEVVAEERIILH